MPRTYAVISCAAFLLCLSAHVSLADEKPSIIEKFITKALSPDPGSCTTYSKRATQAIFRKVQGINLYVDMDGHLNQVIRCHGQEDQCAAKFSNAAEYAAKLKQDFEALPKALHTENIAKIFKEKLEKSVVPFVNWVATCQSTEVSILDRNEVSDALKRSGFITLQIKIVTDIIGKEDKLRAVALTTYLYRPDTVETAISGQPRRTYTIPIAIEQNDDEINRRIQYAADHAGLYVESSQIVQ